jgi:Na+/alanine symporter
MWVKHGLMDCLLQSNILFGYTTMLGNATQFEKKKNYFFSTKVLRPSQLFNDL